MNEKKHTKREKANYVHERDARASVELVDAGQGMLRIIIPKIMLEYSKCLICDVFQKEKNIVEENEWWLD
ncbi:hypothetical protein [Flavobacterium tyrosinilyticum]|uniref:hypothetical protein n=1 Tax=Flavobacterium tyrosinilyticum TaxID=1658740 RepID=UPI00203069FE|nr:hypothetical protein [Flavobacterium tyrosinilyticum]MCM0665623.1 hypothetical protein [Flavobacterium tyrosinilyticum]